MKYIIGLDQSTQGTKAVLFDEAGSFVDRVDKKHAQIVNEKGWVSHNLTEIYNNALETIRCVIEKNAVAKTDVAAIGISNQRETTAIWNRQGQLLADAIVWQCRRAEEIAKRHQADAELIYERTGIPLSPYFPAAKMEWLLEQIKLQGKAETLEEAEIAEEVKCSEAVKNLQEMKHSEAAEKSQEMKLARQVAVSEKVNISEEDLCLGSIDSWLLYKLTGGAVFATDYSNASRTQLFNLKTLSWDADICKIFHIPMGALAEVRDSNACFGCTTLEGFFEKPVPIHAVLGDSHAALFGQGCHSAGMVKATYGTGSSIMMHIGSDFRKSNAGLVTSLAWSMDGKAEYVLEGNINYAGAVISWLQDDMHLIASAKEVEGYIEQANAEDTTVLVPAFTGLGAPYWKGNAKAMLYGMSRTTGRAEIVKAAAESIAYQVADVLHAMEEDGRDVIRELRVDGGPTKNHYLMQFESDITHTSIRVSKQEELSAIGAAYMAGIAAGLYKKAEVFANLNYEVYEPKMEADIRRKKAEYWKEALDILLK